MSDPTPIADAFTPLAAAIPLGGPAAMAAFWHAVYQLDEWHFLPDRPALDAMAANSPVFPLACRFPEGLFIVAFTSEERAHAAARLANLVGPDAPITLLSMPRDAAVDLLCSLPDNHIAGVIFNHNHAEGGVYAPLDNIAAMYEYETGQFRPALIDRFVRAVTASNSPQAWARLTRRLLALDRWLIAANPERRDVPLLVRHGDGLCALVFTDENHAARAAAALNLADNAGNVPTIELPPRDAVRYLEELRTVTRGTASETIINIGAQPFSASIGSLRAALDAGDTPSSTEQESKRT